MEVVEQGWSENVPSLTPHSYGSKLNAAAQGLAVRRLAPCSGNQQQVGEQGLKSASLHAPLLALG